MLGLDAFRRKPRQFDYKPLHYDPKKEAREKRKKELLGDDAEDVTEDGKEGEYTPGTYIRAHGFSRKSISIAPRVSSQQRSRSIQRAVIALILLFLILIYIIVT